MSTDELAQGGSRGAIMTRIDFHTHVVVDLPDFAARYHDPRWPSFEVDGGVGLLSRDGQVVRRLAPSAWSAPRRVEDMDAAGIDVQVLSPIPPLGCDWPEPERAARWCEHLNEGIASIVAGNPRRFAGLGTVPLQHPDLAVAAIEHAHRLGLAGVEIGTDAGGRELDDPALSDFFAAPPGPEDLPVSRWRHVLLGVPAHRAHVGQAQ
jgi:aminocarboxymuconate-semialdehyde decarboxylase